ncbi:MAG: hypothetical protein ACMG6S_05530 [Byssovorax sp.]
MSARHFTAALVLAAPLLGGRAVELGGRVGLGGPISGASETRRFVWTSGVAGHIVVFPTTGSRNGIYLGSEVENRNEATIGSRWSMGSSVGFARVPQRKLGAVGFELHADMGTRILEGVLFPNGDLYLGSTAALPIWLFPARQLSDVNNDPWILTRALELVFSVRGRAYFDHTTDALHELAPRYDATFGFALRTRFVSDFM